MKYVNIQNQFYFMELVFKNLDGFSAKFPKWNSINSRWDARSSDQN